MFINELKQLIELQNIISDAYNNFKNNVKKTIDNDNDNEEDEKDEKYEKDEYEEDEKYEEDEEEYEIEYEDKDSIDIQKYIFSEEHILELIEIFFYLIDDYIKYNPHIINNVGFYNILLEDIQDLFYLQIEDYIIFIQKQ